MKLLTEKLKRRFLETGPQVGQDLDPIVVCRFHQPSGSAFWLVTDVYYGWPVDGTQKTSVYAWVSSRKQWQWCNLDVLKTMKRLVRDKDFKECRFSTIEK